MVRAQRNLIQAEFKIMTPMFLGDADRAVAAHRSMAASLKGAWRFWWRALIWPSMVSAYPKLKERLCALRDREIQLFGGPSTSGGEGRQSPIRFQFVRPPPEVLQGQRSDRAGTILYPGDGNAGLRYLGYGLIHPAGRSAGELLRDAIAPGQTFTVKFCFAERLRPKDRKELLDSLKLLGLMGGLGARTRRGFGSLKLQRLTSSRNEECWSPQPALDGYCRDLGDLIADYDPAVATTLPAITAFCKGSRVQLKTSTGDWRSLMNWAGQRMLQLRSWGYQDQQGVHRLPTRQEALQLFPADHDFAQQRGFDNASGQPIDFVPERAVFGLPHRYEKKRYFNQNRPHIPGEVYSLEVLPAAGGRRASPLLFHVHELDGDENFTHALVVTIFQACFLPGAGDVAIAVSQGSASKDTSTRRLSNAELSQVNRSRAFTPDWNLLNGFLRGRKHPARGGSELPPEPAKLDGLPNRIVVWPRPNS